MQAPVSASPWCCAGGGPAHTGLFPRPVRMRGRPVRRLTTRGAVQAGVVFDSAGRAFVADMQGVVLAFDPEGARCWERQVVGGISATPAVDVSGGRLFVGTHRGRVYALSTRDGAVLWERPLPTASDPRITADLLWLPRAQRLVTSSWGGQFHALDAGTGRTLESWEAGLYPSAGAAATTQEVIFCLRVNRGGGVQLVRREPDGRETLLHQEPEGPRGAARIPVTAAPVVDEARGRVWWVANDGWAATVLAATLSAGEVAGRWPLPRGVQVTPALAPDGALRVADLGGELHRFRVGAAAPDCRYPTGAEYLLASPVCEAGGCCWVGDPLGRLHEVTADGRGRVVFEAARALQAPPSFDPAGNLHLPGTDRTVYVWRNRA